MSEQQRRPRREGPSDLLSLRTRRQPLAPHELVSSPECRREGLRLDDPRAGRGGECSVTGRGGSGGAAAPAPPFRWTEEVVSIALGDNCPHDDYLGLRWYRRDPLPFVRRACRTANENRSASSAARVLFEDPEFPAHDGAHVTVVPSPGARGVRCIPGVVSSSNCRDFRSDPKRRLPRVQHFLRQAGRSSMRGGPNWTWVRGASTGDNGGSSLFSAGRRSVDPRNVLQGRVGNCGLCAGFASVAAGWPDVLIDAFGTESAASLAECGAVSVRLFLRGEARYLLMDDYVLCHADGAEGRDKSDKDRGRRTSSSPPSMHSLLRDDLWVRLLEKALVKVQGSYASLDGHYKYNSLYRHPARAVQLLTGAPTALEVHYAAEDADAIYDVLAAARGRCAVVVHCRRRVDGLRSNHGYSLLWVGEGVGQGAARLVCLRNPHGGGSYTGRYGFGRPPGELRRALLGEDFDGTLPECFAVCETTGRIVWEREGGCHPAFRSKGGGDRDDGIFFMEFGRFVECFPLATLVGPVGARTEGASPEEAGAAGAVREEQDSAVPDCLHVVERENLAYVTKMLRVDGCAGSG